MNTPSELDTFANESDVMWRGFVASAIAAVSLQWVNPFGTAKLVLFQVILVLQFSHVLLLYCTGHKHQRKCLARI